ncbi:hypothetical protein [Frigoriglobus tundricola]|uniref:ACT domain-containing protein n=1 Tax=Frigoriglobus tundricola TaxID=2774151 RepID=A0A6M5Z7X1_9BACT|nr:hypothetical protein [Frigoriglobus tundricola]QJX01343.1 hypothetical protein FTUN_8987 [Frigoriglobus tundricola]
MSNNLSAANGILGDDVTTLARLPLMTNTRRPLGRMAFVLPGRVSTKQRMLLGVLSKDARGIAAHVAAECARRGVTIAHCFGAQAVVGQGSFFEVTASDEHEDALAQLLPAFDRDDSTLEDQPPLEPDRTFDLQVDVFDKGDGRTVALEVLLRDLFTLVAENKGNLTKFNAMGVGADLPLDRLAEVSANLDLPKGVSPDLLHKGLLNLCPSGVSVALRELNPLTNPYRLVLKK